MEIFAIRPQNCKNCRYRLLATLQTTVFSLYSHFVVFLQLKKRKKEKIACRFIWGRTDCAKLNFSSKNAANRFTKFDWKRKTVEDRPYLIKLHVQTMKAKKRKYNRERGRPILGKSLATSKIIKNNMTMAIFTVWQRSFYNTNTDDTTFYDEIWSYSE